MNRAALVHLAEAAIAESENTLSGDIEDVLDAVEPAIREDERARIARWIRSQSRLIVPGRLRNAIADKIEKGEF